MELIIPRALHQENDVFYKQKRMNTNFKLQCSGASEVLRDAVCCVTRGPISNQIQPLTLKVLVH